MTTLHDFTMQTLEGEEKALRDFAGQVVLIVNVASKCGLTPQYEGLERLHERFDGFAVLGFPCNQFGAQEPGTAEEIRQFCTASYGVRFPLFAKLDVNGEAAHPLYAWLSAQPTAPDGSGPIAWNFAKFLVDGEGAVIARFAPDATPDDLVEPIERALA